MPGVKSVADRTEPNTMRVTLTEPPGGLREFGGSEWPEFNGVLVKATIATVPAPDNGVDGLDKRIVAACAGLAAFKPVDEIEGMIAAQAVGLHQAAMMCLGRAAIPGQPFELASKHRKDAANMARAMGDMLDLMDRKRGKAAQQVVRVERVVVHEGGQAIVGNVAPAPGTPGGPGRGRGDSDAG
jgi:hypothetical protein